MHIDFGLRRNFSWTFIIADVTKPIIGSDFLKHFHLLPDLKRKALIDGKTDLQVSAKISKYPSLDITTLVKDDSVYNKLLMKYLDVYQASTLPGIKTEHGIYHHIETTVYAKPRRLDQNRFQIAKKDFEYMIEHGIIRSSSSNWSNPLHMVPKKNGEWRCVGDYRFLNKVTVPDRYPISFITDANINIASSCIFQSWIWHAHSIKFLYFLTTYQKLLSLLHLVYTNWSKCRPKFLTFNGCSTTWFTFCICLY